MKHERRGNLQLRINRVPPITIRSSILNSPLWLSVQPSETSMTQTIARGQRLDTLEFITWSAHL